MWYNSSHGSKKKTRWWDIQIKKQVKVKTEKWKYYFRGKVRGKLLIIKATVDKGKRNGAKGKEENVGGNWIANCKGNQKFF